jgi:hypothetical protein
VDDRPHRLRRNTLAVEQPEQALLDRLGRILLAGEDLADRPPARLVVYQDEVVNVPPISMPTR